MSCFSSVRCEELIVRYNSTAADQIIFAAYPGLIDEP